MWVWYMLPALSPRTVSCPLEMLFTTHRQSHFNKKWDLRLNCTLWLFSFHKWGRFKPSSVKTSLRQIGWFLQSSFAVYCTQVTASDKPAWPYQAGVWLPLLLQTWLPGPICMPWSEAASSRTFQKHLCVHACSSFNV